MTEIPEPWSLTFALDVTARKYGWIPYARTTSRDEIVVIYRKDPLIALVDSLPDEED